MDSSTFPSPSVYDAAADDYERVGRRYWSFLAERMVARLAPPPGGRVLDAAAGTGFATIPAAERVGGTGHVVAVDLAPRMLERARARARASGLEDRIEFVETDMTRLDGVSGDFDAVVCVLGLFLVDDMVGLLRALWARVRPGGRLGVTTIGPEFFEPLSSRLRDALADIRPDVRFEPPWHRTREPATVSALFGEAGIPDALVVIERETLPAHSPDDLWGLVTGTGLGACLQPLTSEEVDRLRADVTSTATGIPLTSLHLSAIYASCERPG